MLGLPPATRVLRYRSLVRVGCLKGSLKAIKPDVLPEPESEVAEPDTIPDVIQAPVPHYHQYRCLQENPLSCSQVAIGERSVCENCYFPSLLPAGGLLTGKQGAYKIGRSLGRRGIGRLYTGMRVNSEQPVVIQEYLLPEKYFSPEEQQQYIESFVSLAGLTLADGRTQDARIVQPLEAIADESGERCYLVTPAVDGHPTLNQHCARQGPGNSATVLSILNQVLQTLIFLHQQKFTLPAGQVQEGVIHGHLSLDSLLWVANPKAKKTREDAEGFVYLTDFALWEQLFDPALVDRGQPTHQDDLAALGQVAFYLLNGATLDTQGNPLSPHMENDWPDTYTPLKQFILRLLAIDPPFADAVAARTALLAIPPEPMVSQWDHRPDEQQTKKAWYRRWVPILIVAAILTTLGTLGWLLLRSQRPSYAKTPLPPCCFEDVDAVPVGPYTYAMPMSAYWYPLFQTAEESSPQVMPLFNQLQTLHPELSLAPWVTNTVDGAIAAIQSGQADFAIVPVTTPLPPDITGTIVAYDSLVPIVAFNYPERTKGLPHSLRGKITLDDLSQLYTGELDNWQQLGATDLTVKRYWPVDPTAQTIFAQQVLATDKATELPEATPLPTNSFISIEEPDELPTLTMLRWILQDFENTTIGSIGIAPLSQVFGQCSVYPLALPQEKQWVTPFVFNNGQSVGPETDLCDRKGSYTPNAKALRSGTYPLAYPITVIYPFDNSRSPIGKKVAELLLTQESQAYLTSLGMVSAYPF
ncbi:MAG: phosphate ABC transporter substrate-binding protein [Cyanobacteria bacterium P01_D01_bin.156]